MQAQRQPSSSDRGSAFLLIVLLGVGLIGGVTLALVPLLGDLVDRQRARSAADAAALAGVTGGRAAAAEIAAANGAVLVAWEESGDDVLVAVVVGDQRVAARATDAS